MIYPSLKTLSDHLKAKGLSRSGVENHIVDELQRLDSDLDKTTDQDLLKGIDQFKYTIMGPALDKCPMCGKSY